MFKAFVVICGLMSDQCIKINDTRGPYNSSDQCAERTEEMIVLLLQYPQLPEPHSLTGICEKLGVDL